MKVSLLDTVLRVETENGETKVELRIKRIEYLDETEDKVNAEDGLPVVYLKKVLISGVTFWHDQKIIGDFGKEAESFYESPPESPGSSPPPPPMPQGEPRDSDTFALIGEAMGTQEVRVRIQAREGSAQPRLSLDATLQALTFFVCPRQIHSILDLINSLSNASSKSKPVQRIRPDEFNRIEPQVFYEEEQDEPETQFEFRPGGVGEDQFYSLYNPSDPMTRSMTSSCASTLSTSSTGTMTTRTAPTSKRRSKPRENTAQTDSGMGGFQYAFKLSSVSVCILHSDPAHTAEHVDAARDYFDQMRKFSFSGLTSRRIKDLAADLHEMMSRDRLLLFAFPITGSVNQSVSTDDMHINLQIGQMWLWESLYADSCPDGKSLQLPILKFKIDTTKSMIEAMPLVGHCFKLTMSQSRRSTQLSIDLGEAAVDLDPSIVDRIGRLLAYHPKSHKTDPQSHDSLVTELSSPEKSKSTFDFVLQAANFTLLLRIPVPDKRDEVTRRPFYERVIREEHIKVDLAEFSLSIPQADSVRLMVREILLFFRLSDLDLSTPPFIMIESGYDSITHQPIQPQMIISTRQNPAQSMQQSYYDEYTNKTPQTVFSNQQTSYGSEGGNNHDGRQSVEKPASPAEIVKFKRNVDDTARTFVELDFPIVEIEMHSRQFYEKFFNRIAWDLAMWQPSQLAPSVETPTKQVFFDCDGIDQTPTNYGLGSSTDFALELVIGRGLVKLNCRESHEMNHPVVTAQLAKFNLFFAAKYLSGPADYLYIAAHDLEVKHRSQSMGEDLVWLYATQPYNSIAAESPLLAVSLKIENEELTRSLAHFTVGIALSQVSVRFRLMEPGMAPWDHAAVIFKIEEELPIGYTPPAYITDLHFQLNRVQIDYRPLHLPTSSLLCIESFMLSTMLRPNSEKALLSMIGEKISLYLTNRPPQPETVRVDINYDW